MAKTLLKSAMFYHNEGLCVIPVREREKAPALDWEVYQTRRSTKDEIIEWFGNGHNYNIGIVHGSVSSNYIAIDIDHDNGALADIRARFPELLNGRIEQSGSGEGYHIPLRLDNLPDFGNDSKHDRPRGNKTWKTDIGDINIRAAYCQTVAPPSIHPSGKRYRFIKKGDLAHLPDLDDFIGFLDELAPQPIERQIKKTNKQSTPPASDTLLGSVLTVWSDVIKVFQTFNRANEIKEDKGGEYRLLGNGGLLVTADKQRWYNFSDEIGGSIVEAWGYCRFGQYDKYTHFRKCLVEMAEHAGIDISQFRAKEETPHIDQLPKPVNKIWKQKYRYMWERVR